MERKGGRKRVERRRGKERTKKTESAEEELKGMEKRE